MRGATECARRLKLLFSSLRSKLGKVGHPPLTDPITQLILGVLSRDTPEAKSSEGLERLRGIVVDYNELRVIPPIELAGILGDFADARLKCEDISRALNAVFALEHGTTLDRLAGLPKKETIAALEQVDGLEPYTRARIRLLGLRQHATPLDEAMWATARAERIVDQRCPLLEAQHFLERQIAEEDALEFVALLKRHAWSEMGAAVKRREVERIRSVPPDRTARNMLQMVSPAAVLDAPDESGGDTDETLALLAESAPGGSKTDGGRVLPGRHARPGQPRSRARTAPKNTQATRPAVLKAGARVRSKVKAGHRAAPGAAQGRSTGKRAGQKPGKVVSASRARKSKSA